MGSVVFSTATDSVTIQAPQWGYKTDINMALEHASLSDPSYGIWDHGSAYDVRMLSLSKWLMNSTDLTNLNDFFSDPAKGRGATVNMQLGGNPSGFFPFGPDKGDKGTFAIRAINYDQTGQLHRPWKWFETGIVLSMVTAPSYSLPAQISDGNLQIGTITNLRYPQDGYSIRVLYNVRNIVTNDGTPYEIDRGQPADSYQSSFTVSGNQSKIAALTNYLTGTARGSNFSIVTQTDNYIFGLDKNNSGTYTVQLLDKKLSISHMHHDEFLLTMNLNFISVA